METPIHVEIKFRPQLEQSSYAGTGKGRSINYRGGERQR